MTFEKNEFGLIHRASDFIFFFGNKNSSLDNLCAQFPDIEFRRLKQTHGDVIIESSTSPFSPAEGDAHLCRIRNIGLVSVTADCVPILLYDAKTNYIASIHAGWRGVAKNNFAPAATWLSSP